MLNDWRFLIFIYLLLTGVWGVLAKISASRLNPFTATFIAVTSCWVVVAATSFSKLQWQSRVGIVAALACGLISGLAAIAFYGALKIAPASVVVPLSSLYVVLTVVLARLRGFNLLDKLFNFF
jgi:uncharacterized membrane protein